jgi:hypothetical protein
VFSEVIGLHHQRGSGLTVVARQGDDHNITPRHVRSLPRMRLPRPRPRPG